MSGQIAIDGSSNVYPLTEAAAKAFQREHPNVLVVVSSSSTPTGLKLFCDRHTQISNACRPMNASERQLAQSKGLEFIELPIAHDALTVVVHPENTWVDHLTVEELQRLWETDSTVKTWSDLRPGWPARPVKLSGPKATLGTFDCFSCALFGQERHCRTDYDVEGKDKKRIERVAEDIDALTFCGYGHVVTSPAKVRMVPVAQKEPATILPSTQTIQDGTYQPFLRPFFLYVSRDAADRPEVNAFVHYYLDHASEYASAAGYVPLSAESVQLAKERFAARTTGSVFSDKLAFQAGSGTGARR